MLGLQGLLHITTTGVVTANIHLCALGLGTTERLFRTFFNDFQASPNNRTSYIQEAGDRAFRWLALFIQCLAVGGHYSGLRDYPANSQEGHMCRRMP